MLANFNLSSIPFFTVSFKEVLPIKYTTCTPQRRAFRYETVPITSPTMFDKDEAISDLEKSSLNLVWAKFDAVISG